MAEPKTCSATIPICLVGNGRCLKIYAPYMYVYWCWFILLVTDDGSNVGISIPTSFLSSIIPLMIWKDKLPYLGQSLKHFRYEQQQKYIKYKIKHSTRFPLFGQ